jgi:hypothetical protein
MAKAYGIDTTRLQEILINQLKNAKLVRHTHRFRAGDYERLRAVSKETGIRISTLVRFGVNAVIEWHEEDPKPTGKK